MYLREITLSVSCPEVARILMEREAPVRFLSYEKDGDEEYDEFDPFLFSAISQAQHPWPRSWSNLPSRERSQQRVHPERTGAYCQTEVPKLHLR